MPPYTHLSNADSMLLVLNASSPLTHVHISYECLASDDDVEERSMSLTVWVCIAAAGFCAQCVCCSVSATYFVRRRRAQRHQLDANVDLLTFGMALMHEAANARRRGAAADAEHLRASQLERRRRVALDRLPRSRVSEEDEERYAGAECSLCLEKLRCGDELRRLPCTHEFHQACIDRWFDSKTGEPRSCPLCKGDPLDAVDLDAIELPPLPPLPLPPQPQPQQPQTGTGAGTPTPGNATVPLDGLGFAAPAWWSLTSRTLSELVHRGGGGSDSSPQARAEAEAAAAVVQAARELEMESAGAASGVAEAAPRTRASLGLREELGEYQA